jgi:uncharacterized protein YjeT (DUF2065 family)
MLIFEGLMPLVCPRCWKDAFTRILSLRDGQLRFLGLAAVLAGAVVMLLLYD